MNPKGFTLIEMVVVMAIISLLTLTLTSGYAYENRQEMKRFAEQLGETIQIMQQKASIENGIYALNQDIKNDKSYMVVTNYLPSYREEVFKYEVPKAFEIKMNVDQIKFSQDMSPAYAGTISIKHRYLPYQIRLTVRPVTGLVTLYPLEEI